MTRIRHVIGAGVSGLAAAHLAGQAGIRTIVHEASPHPGGRCRTLARHGLSYDNGTHVLLTANRRALALLRAIGAERRWVEPEPDGLPVVGLPKASLATVGLSPWSWALASRRPPGVGLADLARLLPMLATPGARSVASYAGSSPGLLQFLDMTSAAVLNTSPNKASARLLAIVFRRLLLPGASRLLVAREGLGPDLIQPLAASVQSHGGSIRLGRRLMSIRCQAGRAVALVFGDGVVALGPEDEVVLALPPAALRTLLPEVPVPTAFEPIVNLHWAHRGRGPIRFIGVTGGVAQWILVRPGMLSVTVSAAAGLQDLPGSELAARVWPEVAAACGRLGVDIDGASPADVLVVKERAATPRQDSAYAQLGSVERRPLANLALAGDWTSGLPATIEGAVVSAHAASRALSTPSSRHALRRAGREALA
ncbi:MAG TPA: FAD-dependent oxidoreductase [Geminicoccus sp.]|jgi:hypothetical protein|uniref:hydroxysqualene dehydroxylase n=1 Tax=Geminicoccus sp. TaxID=2024832 RepID=UPI002E307E1A|nr:FAD-dependent oxidoreductase [Geminicoccus sp.]HEX2528890.1 FAD-dependent oxidoreductase [Geminicoccus sp.]